MAKCLLTKGCPTDSNYLTIKINPDEGFYLEINVKEPGTFNKIIPVEMNFCHSCIFGPNTPAAYENLLLDVIEGDQSAFVRSDEIEQSWKIIEQIKKEWMTIHPYKKESDGPKALEKLDTKPIRWRA
jgi:glucose-6-phosphate 1-dehydrogenase